MREILFRGKWKNSGEWVYGNLFNPDKADTPTQICIGTYIARTCYEIDPETVGQYTGLHDKNGRKIFEGDIVRCYYSDISPFTDEIEPYEKEVLIDDILRSEVIGWIDCADELEIIGNIYDNPELLEVKQNEM